MKKEIEKFLLGYFYEQSKLLKGEYSGNLSFGGNLSEIETENQRDLFTFLCAIKLIRNEFENQIIKYHPYFCEENCNKFISQYKEKYIKTIFDSKEVNA